MPDLAEQLTTTATGTGWSNFGGEPATSPLCGDGIEFPLVDFTGASLASVPSGSVVSAVVGRLVLYAGPDATQITSIALTKGGVVVGSAQTYQTNIANTTETLNFNFTGLSLSYASLQGADIGLRVQFEAPIAPNSESTVSVESASVIATYFIAPVVSNNTASASAGAGGTVQMSATNTPTSWSLPGSPPTGVSINSSGLVTWTSNTPVGVHTITVRATNAGGDGDGTLTLTITAATSQPRPSTTSVRVGVGL